MAKQDKAKQIPIYRELETLYVWLATVTARAPKTPAWDTLCVQIHQSNFHALHVAEAGVNMEDSRRKLELIDLLTEDIKVIKTIFRLFCRMSATMQPRVVSPDQEREFSLRMIKIGNNLSHWRNAYLSKNIPSD